MKQIEKFLKDTFNIGKLRPELVCKDGFKMSVQGSNFHYCIPREDQDWYDKVEVGFPNEIEPLILQYAEDPDNPTKTVYGYDDYNEFYYQSSW